jgi:maltose alpha-D-glucosyltransferase/alpha-amylase
VRKARSERARVSDRARKRSGHLVRDPLWYKDAVVYELRVGAFQDSDADGKGDFRGLTQRLDYLQDLGVTALWLLPFYPSPLRDDGYDISDYRSIHPECGALDDFKAFLREAHQRGLRVITELVINHTSDQHPWFQRARRAPPGSRWRDYYVWSDTPDRYREARVIFKDFEHSNWSWDPLAKAYYWHRFYAHQPDLNFESPEVRRAVLRFVDFWFGLGVDGLRLDAIPYLFEREGSACENLPETHAFLRELRGHVDARFEDRMLLAEANQWPEDAVAYLGKGDECHMAFHFPLMPRLFMSVQMEDRFPILDILKQTPAIPENCQWALFLRNHDELTLEMVTDEERDYMYRVYAHEAQARINLGIRRRLAPLLGNDRRRIELLNALLCSLPGTPVIYYGDEIGMGDNFYLGDRNGVRTPMQWSSDRNAGFSRANPQRLYLPVILDPEYHYESINVEAQQANRHSLLAWMKRLIALRRRHHAFGRGSIEFLQPSNRKVLAFLRQYGDQCLLVVANLSRFVQYVELDLQAWKGCVAVELFGQTPFPPIGELPYLLTLGPHSFYWFALEAPRDARGAPEPPEAPLPVLAAVQQVEAFSRRAGREALEAALPAILQRRRWFAGKGRAIERVSLLDAIPVAEGATLAFADVAQAESRHTYALCLATAHGARVAELRERAPASILAELEPGPAGAGALVEGLEEPEICHALLDAIGRRRRIRGAGGELAASAFSPYRALVGGDPSALRPALLRGEQSNSSVAFGEKLVLKLFRRLSEGVNPELEIGRFLTERTSFRHIAPLAGALEYRMPRREPLTVGLLQGFVPNQGDAWSYTLDQVQQFFERALARKEPPPATARLLDLVSAEPPPLVPELLGDSLETARLLGTRTAELHRALASDGESPDFAPEPLGSLYRRSLYQSMRNHARGAFRLFAERRPALPDEARLEPAALAALEERALGVYAALLERSFDAKRIRCHGDYHLGQVLHTGSDFAIIDFEGEPGRSMTERRLKRSPLRDVAGMLRSYDYAAHALLFAVEGRSVVRPEDVPALQPWARLWRDWTRSAFLRAYLQRIDGAGLVPHERVQLETLLRALLLEKNVYELAYELDNRPGWVPLPLRGIRELLEEEAQ